MNAFTEALIQKAKAEEAGAYRPYYLALRKLESEYQRVFERQLALFQDDEEPLEYAIANLMFSAHASSFYPNTPHFDRKAMLNAVQAVLSVPTGHACLVSLIVSNFPQAMFSAEYAFFKNRTVMRLFEKQDKDRPEMLQSEKVEEWTVPMERIEELREMAVQLWQKEEADDS